MKKEKIYKVGIAGYGVVGKRRKQVIDEYPNLKVVAVCDKTFKEPQIIENNINAYSNYSDLLTEDIDIVFVCLTNDMAPIVTIESLKNGKHVFCEKPPGRTVDDIKRVIEQEKKSNLVLKYGFNHRYHKSVQMAIDIIRSKKLGELVNIRGVYGKSKIVSFKSGWRSKREIAGGGILLDQGIHMIDLILLFCSEIVEIKSFISNKYWNHNVEDNAYALLKDKAGVITILHSSATEWEHKFNMNITLSEGYLNLTGILSGSKSYGEETITIGERNENSEVGQLGSKTLKFLTDDSWKLEVEEFVDAIIHKKEIINGRSKDALKSMQLVFEIYNEDKEWI